MEYERDAVEGCIGFNWRIIRGDAQSLVCRLRKAQISHCMLCARVPCARDGTTIVTQQSILHCVLHIMSRKEQENVQYQDERGTDISPGININACYPEAQRRKLGVQARLHMGSNVAKA